jgi:uncharacterized protein (DUF2236 family)
MLPAFPDPADAARKLLIGRVRAVFHDRDKGETPVVRSNQALFKPGSAIWRVHGDVTTMMIGGIAALLLQMLHPAVLAGVWEFSAFRDDLIGRLRRTARFIAVTTYADEDAALAVIARVKAIHREVRGRLPDGSPYAADDPDLLAWVHACEAQCFLEAWLRYGNPGMSLRDQDRYVAESGRVALMLGADPVPETRAEVAAMIEATRPRLRSDERTEAVRQIVIAPPAPKFSTPVQRVLSDAAIGLLPVWAREMHGLPSRPLNELLASGGATAIATALRWAFSARSS